MKNIAFVFVAALLALPMYSGEKIKAAPARETPTEVVLSGTIIKKVDEAPKAEATSSKTPQRNPYHLKLADGTELYIPKYAVKKDMDFEPFVNKSVSMKAGVLTHKTTKKQRIVKVISVDLAKTVAKTTSN